MSNVKYLYLALIYGIVVGIWAGIIFILIFPQVGVVTREIPYSAIPVIFLRNSFAVTMITTGGIISSLIDARIWRHKKVSGWLNKSVDPWYFLLKRFSGSYEKLGKYYRSLYFGLFAFPVVSI